jgi:hypothetical protein
MQQELNAGAFSGNFPEISWPDEIDVEGDSK